MVTSTGLGADYKLLFPRSRNAGIYLSIAWQGLSSNVPDAPPSPCPRALVGNVVPLTRRFRIPPLGDGRSSHLFRFNFLVPQALEPLRRKSLLPMWSHFVQIQNSTSASSKRDSLVSFRDILV